MFHLEGLKEQKKKGKLEVQTPHRSSADAGTKKIMSCCTDSLGLGEKYSSTFTLSEDGFHDTKSPEG